MSDPDDASDTVDGTSDSDADGRVGAAFVHDALVGADVELVVGLPGTQTLPLDRLIAARDELSYLMVRHETAAPHVAWGYYEVAGRPAATLVVPGPGDTLSMHGLKNALDDRVPLFHVAADVAPADRGKGPIHEIAPDTVDNAVKTNLTVDRSLELRAALARGVATALAPPRGPVRFGIPSDILAATSAPPPADVAGERTTYDIAPAIEAAADVLATARRPLVYVGNGCRRTAAGERIVTELATRLDAPVAASFKGKGVFPETDDRWLGVTAGFMPPDGRAAFAAADAVLALGTRFSGPATDDWSLPMGDHLVHVTVDPETVDAGYAADVPVLADVTRAGEALLEALADRECATGWDGAAVGRAVREAYRERLAALGSLDRDRAPARTPAVLEAVRAATPTEAVVTADVGGFRLWALQTFPTAGADRFVTCGAWAGMGVALPAAAGAAVADDSPHPVVCLTGDGGLLMCLHELHTIADHDLDVVVVVANNADYGIISKSPKLDGDALGFDWPSPAFVPIAEGFGWTAERVETAAAAGAAVDRGLAATGPYLIDVAIDPAEPSVIEAADYDPTASIRDW